MATVVLSGLKKVYPNGMEAVHAIDLEVGDGEFMVLVGPSGCGKTTVLRMVAGLEKISGGEVRIGDRVVNNLEPKDRDIAMVFQNYALYPHMTVAGNIGFALKVEGTEKATIAKKVQETAEILGLTDWLDRKPSQLSGGQRQRVAMGRAIVREPTVFLMDEPLSNLDAKLRVQTRAEVSRLQKRLGVSTLYVTHDQVEAMTMGHRVAVMNAGFLSQCDTPQQLYAQPANMFVAGFIGSPAMNLFAASIDHGLQSVTIGSQTLALPTDMAKHVPGLVKYAGKDLVIGLRPEHLALRSGETGHAVIRVDVDLNEQLGSEQMLHFSIDANRIVPSGVDGDEAAVLAGGDGVARIAADVEVLAGTRADLSIDVKRAHFFDRDTEQVIR